MTVCARTRVCVCACVHQQRDWGPEGRGREGKGGEKIKAHMAECTVKYFLTF